MLPIKHLSASQIESYRECSLAWYGRTIMKWPEVHPPFLAQAFAMGSAVHAALEAHHQGKDATRALCVAWGSIQVPMDGNKFGKALSLVRAYIANEDAHPDDVVEQKFRLEIPGVDIPIIGYIDRQRGLTVREYKTTGSKSWWTQKRADESLQMSIYLMAVSAQHHGAQASGEYHILNHADTPVSHTVLYTTRNKAQQEEAKQIIRETYEQMKTGALDATCKPGRCRFPEQCREWGYEEPVSIELALPR